MEIKNVHWTMFLKISQQLKKKAWCNRMYKQITACWTLIMLK